MMDQKEHVATLAALGTVGLAVTGFALGTNEETIESTRPGKRKWPGSTITSTFAIPKTPAHGQRSVSQPASSMITHERRPSSSMTSLFRKKSLRDILDGTRVQDDGSDAVESRDSSKSRHSMLRPWTSDTKSSAERADNSTSSSWLKRMSSLSSNRGSSPASSLRQEHGTVLSSSPFSLARSRDADAKFPNKLVKRATSQRALSYEHANGQILKRPATSHQRSQTYNDMTNNSDLKQKLQGFNGDSPDRRPVTATMSQIWRPFFESGRPRKRPPSDVFLDAQQIRTVVTPYLRCPTLVLGSAVEPPQPLEDTEARGDLSPTLLQRSAPSGRHRLRRSMNSIRRSARRRNFTDPIVQAPFTDTNDIKPSAFKDSPLSPVSHTSTFDVEIPRGTPVFNSSPPFSFPENGFTFRQRMSVTPSELHTTSSDNDTRVFSDDDSSLDFKSDTAYDSIATRATSASHSGLRISKLETIFAERTSEEIDGSGMTLEALMQQASIRDHEMLDVSEGHRYTELPSHQTDQDVDSYDVRASTPIRTTSADIEDMAATPVPKKIPRSDDFSSPPLLPSQLHAKLFEHVGDLVDGMDIDRLDEEIDWSPKVDPPSEDSAHHGYSTDVNMAEHVDPQRLHLEVPQHDSKRSSIFDWSEQQQQPSISPRPRTVHGNQGNDNRSRSSGRKEMHFRSQSVPVNREIPNEETPQTASKYSTWGLGHKPVSEEWSDDFEFDDLEDGKPILMDEGDVFAVSRDSIRSVKVPQAIIDRQASVHLQFGQVQEFMLLVEELKRLKIRAVALHLIEGHSKQLWEDADSIINLATINEEENSANPPASPTSSDIFADDAPTVTRMSKDQTHAADTRNHSGTRRSVSGAATTPVTGRARGESLAQAKSFLQTIHQKRSGLDSSPREIEIHQQKKLPFDTQDLRDLVVRSGVITRALKEIVRKAEGVSVSPHKTPPKPKDPPFSHIFNVPEERDGSPCPPFRKPGLPKSRSANSYLESSIESNQPEGFSTRLTLTAMV